MKRLPIYLTGLLLFGCGESSNDTPINQLFIQTENASPIASKDEYTSGSVNSLPMKIRGRGNSTWGLPKKPYQLKLSAPSPMFGMSPDKKWIMLANYSDKTMLRNELAFDMSRISRLQWTPDSRFAEVTVNGQYDGLYQMTQKVEVTDNRVPVGDTGYLLEVDQLNRLDTDDVFIRTDNYLFNIKSPDADINDPSHIYIRDYLRDTEAALLGEGFRDPNTGYRKYIDVDAFVDWYLINELAKNKDANFFSSVYMTLDPGGKLKMGPVWDFDIGFGNNNNPRVRTFDPIGFHVKKTVWIERLFQDPYFVSKLRDRFNYFYNHRESLYAKVLSNADRIDAAQRRNYQRWGTLGQYVWPNPVYFDTYQEEVDHLIGWLELRFEWMKGELDA